MNILLIFGLVALAAVARANQCDPTMDFSAQCGSISCSDPDTKACEHGTCSCAPKCQQTSDCMKCADFHAPDGHMHPQTVACMNGACVCSPHHMQPPHHDGDHHGPPGK